MATCCNNTVTPKMIRTGQVSVGDKIQLEEYIPMQEYASVQESGTVQASTQFSPLPFSQMTGYMNDVSIGGTVETPSIIKPQDPMTPNGYEEQMDYSSIQSFEGFLRTQIGRYMKIEQLIGSNIVEDRFGFLIGVGNNFIILQEITSGNIMVLDIFSVRSTYIYYSSPVFPNM